MMATFLRCAALAVLPTAVACSGSSDDAVPSPSFGEVFALDQRIQLEEPDGLPITRIEQVNVAPDGRLVLPDGPTHTVRVHAPDGQLIESIGGHGEGPGEFNAPTGAVIAETGYLYVLESLNQRVSRFTPELAYDTLFSIQDIRGGLRMYAVDGDLLLHTANTTPREAGTPVFRRYSQEGDLLGRMHPEHPLYAQVPYWRWIPESAAVGRDEIFIANDKTYPLYRYTLEGEPADSFGTPPPSWIPAPRPERGEFGQGPVGMERFEEFLRSYTWIDNIALYGDSLLVVAHGRYDPEVLAYREAHYRADIYDMDGVKRFEDVDLPGRLLAGGDHAYLLEAEPPEGWMVGRYGGPSPE